jgi:hypothetical protein
MKNKEQEATLNSRNSFMMPVLPYLKEEQGKKKETEWE